MTHSPHTPAAEETPASTSPSLPDEAVSEVSNGVVATSPLTPQPQVLPRLALAPAPRCQHVGALMHMQCAADEGHPDFGVPGGGHYYRASNGSDVASQRHEDDGGES